MNDMRYAVNDGDFCETPTARKILNVLTVSADAPKIGIGLIVGNAGVGKTTALKHFARKRENSTIVTMNGTTTTMTAVLSSLCMALFNYAGKRAADMHEMIVNHFAWNGDGHTLIIDEAQEVNDQIINELRHIYDQTGIGLVLCGNAAFKNRFNHAEASAFAQVTSRMGIRADIQGPTDEDVYSICDSRKVAGSAEQKFVLACSKTSGALRTVTKLINVASTLPDIGKPVMIEHLRAAAGMLDLDR